MEFARLRSLKAVFANELFSLSSRRTKDYMLVYGSKDPILTRYTDSDFQSDKDARKSTSRSVFTLNGGAVV